MTDRREPVALAVPTAHNDRWQELVDIGWALSATGEEAVVDDPPNDHGIDASARLGGVRRARRLEDPATLMTSADVLRWSFAPAQRGSASAETRTAVGVRVTRSAGDVQGQG